MTAQPSRHRSKWSLDFATRAGGSSNSNRGGDAPSPIGYSSSLAQLHGEAARTTDPALRAKRSWDLALGPIKQVPMNLFIMYMSGNTISIFPIMMVAMMAWRPLKTLFSMNATFKALDATSTNADGSSATTASANYGQKIVFVLGNVANVILSLYKFHSMGLLPLFASDWLAFADPIERVEWAYVGV